MNQYMFLRVESNTVPLYYLLHPKQAVHGDINLFNSPFTRIKRLLRRKIDRVRVLAEDRGFAVAALTIVTYPLWYLRGVYQRNRHERAWAKVYGPTFQQFDRRYGIDTAEPVRIADLGNLPVSAARAKNSEGIPEEHFRDALNHVPGDLSRYTFVDIGSGKGKALLLAALSGFKQIIGVELSAELNSVAASNIAKVRHDLPLNDVSFTLRCEDAANLQLPATSSLIYMYNPFDSLMMSHLFANFERQLRNRDYYEVLVVYINPKHREVIEGSTFFETIALQEPTFDGVSPNNSSGYAIYRASSSTVPASEPTPPTLRPGLE